MQVRVCDHNPVDRKEAWVDHEYAGIFDICVATRNEIKEATYRLRDYLDCFDRNRSLRGDLMVAPHLFRNGFSPVFIKVLGDRQTSYQSVDVFHFRQQQTRVKECLVRRTGGIVRMQRTTPQFGPVWRNSGNKRLSINLNVEKILLSFPVESRAEAIRGLFVNRRSNSGTSKREWQQHSGEAIWGRIAPMNTLATRFSKSVAWLLEQSGSRLHNVKGANHHA